MTWSICMPYCHIYETNVGMFHRPPLEGSKAFLSHKYLNGSEASAWLIRKSSFASASILEQRLQMTDPMWVLFGGGGTRNRNEAADGRDGLPCPWGRLVSRFNTVCTVSRKSRDAARVFLGVCQVGLLVSALPNLMGKLTKKGAACLIGKRWVISCCGANLGCPPCWWAILGLKLRSMKNRIHQMSETPETRPVLHAFNNNTFASLMPSL